VNAFTLWQRFAVTIIRGAKLIGAYVENERSVRKWCTRCGGHLLTEHPAWGLVDVHAGVLPGFPFEAQFHLNYGERALRMEDGLPKMRDLPSEMGGSGRTMPE
jgi:hypothetical protein